MILLLIALHLSVGCRRDVMETNTQDDSVKKEMVEVIGSVLFPNHFEPDSVVINLFAYSEIYSEVELVLSKSSDDFMRFLPTRAWEGTRSIIKDEDININNALTDSIFKLADLLFVKKTVPVYSYRERSDSVGPYHEGPILIVWKYKKGIKTYTERIYLEDEFTSNIQYTEDGHAIAYSRPFRFLIQSLYYAQAIASGKKEEYEEHLEDLQNYPGLEILVPLK